MKHEAGKRRGHGKTKASYRVEMWDADQDAWIFTWWCDPHGVPRKEADEAMRRAQHFSPREKYRVQVVPRINKEKRG